MKTNLIFGSISFLFLVFGPSLPTNAQTLGERINNWLPDPPDYSKEYRQGKRNELWNELQNTEHRIKVTPNGQSPNSFLGEASEKILFYPVLFASERKEIAQQVYLSEGSLVTSIYDSRLLEDSYSYYPSTEVEILSTPTQTIAFSIALPASKTLLPPSRDGAARTVVAYREMVYRQLEYSVANDREKRLVTARETTDQMEKYEEIKAAATEVMGGEYRSGVLILVEGFDPVFVSTEIESQSEKDLNVLVDLRNFGYPIMVDIDKVDRFAEDLKIMRPSVVDRIKSIFN